jgi:hypothetical protein
MSCSHSDLVPPEDSLDFHDIEFADIQPDSKTADILDDIEAQEIGNTTLAKLQRRQDDGSNGTSSSSLQEDVTTTTQIVTPPPPETTTTTDEASSTGTPLPLASSTSILSSLAGRS